ncbi:hypothetical protein [Acidovorax delafieldii]|uniref:hypothetical protein n=1 Tax=Acidovorax delafieldii TaxID=47920 RepID=UPI003F509CF0
MSPKPLFRTPSATKGAARAVAAPAAPALGVCTLKGQSGAGMLDLFSSSVLQRPGVSVLFARSDSCYFDLVDDVWDAQRDARSYTGANPVVCHPPCRGWDRLRHWAKPRPDEKALALFAVEQVRRCGGVLEHPWGSTLWHAAELPHPGKVDAWGGWTLLVDQGWWGHAAPKPTYLYIVGCSRENVGELPVQLHRAEGRTLHLSPADRERTPLAFARFLVDVAAKCAGSLLQPPAAAVTASCAPSTVTAVQARCNSDLAAPTRAASKRAAFKAWAQVGVPQRAAAAPSKRSAGAAATRGIQTLPVGNHGENLNESQA